MLKAIDEYHDMTLCVLLEGIVLHSFEVKTAFSPETLSVVRDLKRVCGLDLDASASQNLIEQNENKKEDLDA
jgi:hypothetical protein